MSLAGIKPLAPGFQSCEIFPQVADLDLLEVTVNTIRGPLEFSSHGKLGSRDLVLSLPPGCAGELVVDKRESLRLKLVECDGHTCPEPIRFARYQLPAGGSTTVHLKFT
jgi:hypothetical protein